MSQTYTLALTDENGDSLQVEISPEQALDYGAGKGLAYAVREGAAVHRGRDIHAA